MPGKPAVLFVCLGNICRSPMAEAAFRVGAERIGLEVEVDSAGTGQWHVGAPPDRRAQAVALRHGVEIGHGRARQVAPRDWRRFTHIVALDRQILGALKAMRPADSTAVLSLLLDHVEGRKGDGIADPFYGDAAGFEKTWADVTLGVNALLKRLAAG